MAELLAQYIDRTIAGRDDGEAYLSLFESHSRELAPTFALVKLLRQFFAKGEPSPAFIETLGTGLQLAAQRAARGQTRSTRSWPIPPSRRKVVLGIAALGSLASIAAVFMLSKSRSARTTT
jgi:hypothetical protein